MVTQEATDTGRFQINDIDLHIPPDNIRIDRQAINNYWETLRTRSSIKTRSGFAYLEIQIHVMFTDTSVSNDVNGLRQLCNLVAQFRTTPFCWVENKYLRDAILGGREGQAMAMALTNMEISKSSDPGNVNAVDVYMKFHWFNYLPYMREFVFREDIFSPIPVTNPKQSNAWKLLYQAEQDRGRYLTQISSLGKLDLKMGIRQFALVPREQYVRAQIELDLLNRIKSINTDISLGERTNIKYTKDPELAEQVPVDYLAAAEETMGQAAGIAFLQNLFGRMTSVTEEMSEAGAEFDLRDLEHIANQNIERREDFIEKYQWSDPRFGWSAVKIRAGDTDKKTTLEYSNNIGDTLSKIANAWNKKEAGGAIMMQRLEIADLAKAGVIVNGISISFQNSLAMMPVIGHPYPTFQHTGAMDAVVTISMATTKRSGVQYMTDLYTMYEDQARKNKEIPVGQKNIHIQNDLINMCGLHEFILETMHVETVPGQPGTSNIVLKLVDNPITTSTTENLIPASSLLTDYSVRKAILDILNDKISFNTGAKGSRLQLFNGKLKFIFDEPSQDIDLTRGVETIQGRIYNNNIGNDTKNAQLKAYVDAYIVHLSKAMIRISGALDSMLADFRGKNYRETFPALFLLRDSDVLGIEQIQQDLSPLLAQTDDFKILYNTNEIPKPEAGVETSNALIIAGAYLGASSVALAAPLVALGALSPDAVETAINTVVPKAVETVNNVVQEQWSEEDIKNARSVLSVWQMMQRNGQESQSGPDSEIWKAAMSNLSKHRASQRLIKEAFVQNYLREFHQGVTQLIDAISESDVMSLDIFKDVLSLLEERAKAAGPETTAYPDFPLTEIIRNISKNQTLNATLTDELRGQDFLETYGLKNISLGALINPDFYIYNSHQMGITDPISSTVMRQASEAIIAGQAGSAEPWTRKKQEEAYLTQAYVDLIGDQKNSKVLEARSGSHKIFHQNPPDTAAREAKIKALKENKNPKAKELGNLLGKLQEDAKATEGELSYLAQHTLQGRVRSSIQENNDIKLVPIQNDTGGLMTTNTRKEGILQPNEVGSSVYHTFSIEDSLRITGEPGLGPPSVPEAKVLDPQKEPIWQVPVSGPWKISSNFRDLRTGISEREHTGIDIISSEGKNATLAMDVLAAADGLITDVTQDFEMKPYTYGSKNKSITNETLKKKPVETTVMVKIQHDGNYSSVYKHMLWDSYLEALAAAFKDGRIKPEQRVVRRGQKIGKMGSTGWSTDHHLHFEIHSGGTLINPLLKLVDTLSYKSQGPLSWINPDSESLFTKSVEQLEKEMTSQGYTMMRAYPTFRLYFIESDLDERLKFGFDDFFSYSAVEEITLIRNRKIAADLLILRLTNVSGVLTNRKFKEAPFSDVPRKADDNVATENGNDPTLVNTIKENPIASMMLQPGVQIQLRLGYDNNPEELERVFNGVITDIEVSGAEDIVEITCQSYGIELVQNVIGEAKRFGSWYAPIEGATPYLLEELMATPELVHFGRWERGTPPGEEIYGLLQKRWKIQPQPQDDNIFAPCRHGILSLFDNAPKYTMLNTTIWDVFQEMTLRHPGYIASCVPYEEEGMARSTMFFGVPDQLYFARDPSRREQQVMTQIKNKLKQHIDAWQKLEGPLERLMDSSKRIEDLTDEDKRAINKPLDDDTIEEFQKLLLRNSLLNYTKDKGIVKPFRSYHVLTSTNHILQNTVTSSVDDTFNVVTLQYENDDSPEVDEKTQQLKFDEVESFTAELDAGMPDEEKREMFAQYHNCIGEDMAKSYAIALLADSLKEGYRGSITIIGNPKIKPHDVCYVFDEYTDMFGPIEVEQVVHRFSKREGFITEITPDMCVHINQSSTLSTQDAVGLMAEYWLRRQNLQSLPSIIGSFFDKGAMQNVNDGDSPRGFVGNTMAMGANLGAKAIGGTVFGTAFFFGPGAALVGGGGGILGYLSGTFILRKYITRSQVANALRYSPLVLHNKPMIGGFPARKFPNGFVQRIQDKVAKWTKEAGNAIPLYSDYLSDKLNPNNWVHSMGEFRFF